MSDMVPIKRSAADRKAEKEKYAGASPESAVDDYPSGSRIELDHEALEKLGLHEGAPLKTGTKVKMPVHATVSRSEDHMVDGQSRRRLELQVTHLPQKLGIGGGEDEGKPGAGVRGDLEQAFDKQQGK